MNKIISLALLALGIGALVYGLDASDSIGSRLSRFFTGAPTDKTIWLVIGGVVGIVAGLAGLFRSAKSS